MAGIDALLMLPAFVAVGIGAVVVRRDRVASAPVAMAEEVIVDLEFLRARPAELDQRISELVPTSGRKTLGARMRSVQLAEEPRVPSVIPAVRPRRRTHPLVASR